MIAKTIFVLMFGDILAGTVTKYSLHVFFLSILKKY